MLAHVLIFLWVKLKLSLFLTEHRAMKAYWGSRCITPLFLNLCTIWRWWSASQTGCFTSGERAPGTHWIRVWWAPEPIWMRWWEEIPDPAGIRTKLSSP